MVYRTHQSFCFWLKKLIVQKSKLLKTCLKFAAPSSFSASSGNRCIPATTNIIQREKFPQTSITQMVSKKMDSINYHVLQFEKPPIINSFQNWPSKKSALMGKSVRSKQGAGAWNKQVLVMDWTTIDIILTLNWHKVDTQFTSYWMSISEVQAGDWSLSKQLLTSIGAIQTVTFKNNQRWPLNISEEEKYYKTRKCLSDIHLVLLKLW